MFAMKGKNYLLARKSDRAKTTHRNAFQPAIEIIWGKKYSLKVRN